MSRQKGLSPEVPNFTNGPLRNQCADGRAELGAEDKKNGRGLGDSVCIHPSSVSFGRTPLEAAKAAKG